VTTALICVISVAAFAQFFLIYCRFLLTNSAGVVLSESVRLLLGSDTEMVNSDDFGRILGLLWLCSAIESDQRQMGAIRLYYRALRGIDRLFIPKVSAWAEAERQHCSHFAAVVLDRRISLSREFCA
jgi:hypothetical protein